MKNSTAILTAFLILAVTSLTFRLAMPSYSPDMELSTDLFSTDRALVHVKKMSKAPHAVGFAGHQEVRAYVVGELEKLGLQTSIQEGYTAGDWGNLSRAQNILTRIKGREKGKALMLLSHYDSNPHSALGASDAGSGVATILEGVRAFLARGIQPKNDIIIVITDAEELGLNGADLFANNHPWTKEVGLILNFEARGSGGESYMLIETNRGNGRLIEEFIKAKPDYPVANSLAYSIYKMLPNDTDLTVFREDQDIEGFNFAFIDDHYDYHTVRDNYERLDRESLAHQGSYIMPLLLHFSEANLENLKSLNDYNYFNVPYFGLVAYPFEWIWPMFFLSVVIFLWIIYLGLRKKRLSLKGIAIGFNPLLLILLINGLAGYFIWPFLKTIYPEYQDMLHGFTYNGHAYIASMAYFSIAVCFLVYHWFQKQSVANLLVAPALLWVIICGLLAEYLPGAAFFIIPVYALLAGILINSKEEHPNGLLMAFLSLPALIIFTPFVKMFPVGLGLKMLVSTTLLSSLIFFLLLPLFGHYKIKKALAYLFLLLFTGFLIDAHLSHEFDVENAKPSSLLYVLDKDANTAQWATYEKVPSAWTSQYLGEQSGTSDKLAKKTISSKYSTGFSFVAPATLKPIAGPDLNVIRDTLMGNQRLIELSVSHRRPVNRLEVFTNKINLSSATVNGIALSQYYLANRRAGKLITHYISDNDPTLLKLTYPAEEQLELTFYEASNDLLTHDLFSIPARPENNIPMPFVLNDAILVTKSLHFE
ncbi:M20/M25/M40 family metallo-hydrolase [Lentiprolixibacter aurantiacus]|uniref:Vacuolar membrane protease n=1 Tax=Lentiprolixibacter aurantiacus TaxID=2993939 RepID=A0AAE3MJY7_9FLAO|nr:M20/M25/M40 family metallo-hydrolase [Lentiprolixibacter aurantiacus]MCX2718819.1 M20/M25/M40 family metallo-hydrolase [Lentiprolixibacter aurantiacus]